MKSWRLEIRKKWRLAVRDEKNGGKFKKKKINL